MPLSTQIDYTIRRRRLIREAFEQLAHQTDISFADLESQITQFLSSGDQVKPVLFSLFRSTDEAVLTLLAFALEMLNEPGVILPLLDSLTDPSVPEVAKLHLLPVLEYYDVDLEDSQLLEILAEAFGDLDIVLKHSIEHMLEAMDRDVESLNFLLENFQELPPDVRVAFVRQFGETRDERAAHLLSILARTEDCDAACEAARYLGRIRSPRSVAELELLLQEPHHPQVIAQAKRSLQRLHLVQVRSSPRQQASGSALPIYKVHSSYIDGLGHRILWLAWPQPDNPDLLSAMSLMLHSNIGVQDCFGTVKMDRSEFYEIVHALDGEAGSIEIGFEYALALIRDALWCNHSRTHPIPPEFALWRHLLAQQELTPQRYEPNWLDWGVDVQQLAADDVQWLRSSELHDYEEFSNWVDRSPLTHDYCLELIALMDEPLQSVRERKRSDLFDRYAIEVFEAKRALLGRNLELSADLLMRAGHTQPAQLALAAALRMAADRKTLSQHPFVARMMAESLLLAESRTVQETGIYARPSQRHGS